MKAEEKLLRALYKIITPAKIEKFERIAAHRTRYLTVAVENLYQEHNASAVLRSCDCFGVQDLHVIEKNNTFNVQQEIASGAAQWVNHFHYSDDHYPTSTCINKLKEKGYKIAATTPHTDAFTVNNVPLDEPIAFLFGTEKTGLSEKALALSDYYVQIPMVGFTESFNVSVSAALTMHTIRTRLENQEEINWKLSKKEQTLLKIEWCKHIIKNSSIVIKDFKRRIELGEL